MLKKRILDVAIEEINEKTDLKVVYDLENEGRKITAIVFRVSGITKFESEEKMNEEIMQKLHAMGIRDATAKELLEKHDEDYILANIRFVEGELASGKEIRNVPAYLMKAFEVDFRPIETEHDRVKSERKQSKQAVEQQETAHEKKRIELLKQFERQKVAAVENLLKSLDGEVLNALKEEFLTTVQTNPLFKKMLETKGFDSSIIQLQRRNFLAERHLAKTAYDFEEFLNSEGYDTTDGKI